MHSTHRSPEPEILAELRSAHTRWNDLDAGNRVRIREALAYDFGTVCAFCERRCQMPAGPKLAPNAAIIEHFRPRRWFPHLWLDWLNLVYACNRCNQAKGSKWPGYEHAWTDEWLAASDARYIRVSEYVNPNAATGQRTAREFFSFVIDTGEIIPSEKLDPAEWSIARRTIADIDLNDGVNGQYPLASLCSLRLDWLGHVLRRLTAAQDGEERLSIVMEFTSPDSQFSGFISAYFSGSP